MGGARNMCREIFGTENPDELREIARKAAAYDRMTRENGHKETVNARGAGRRECISDRDADILIELYAQGRSVQYLAEYFHVSRPTVYKYLESERRFERTPSIALRMNFMHDEESCTVIDADFQNKRIYIRNQTDRILWRAFGVKEDPDWADFQYFLGSRCFPAERAEINLVLRDLGLSEYDPLKIIERTGGRMAEDHHWIRLRNRDEVLRRGKN